MCMCLCVVGATQSNESLTKSSVRCRSRRPYYSVSPSQQHARKQEAKAELDRIGVPLEALSPTAKIPVEDLLHLTTAAREQFRSVKSARLPSEKQIIVTKLQVALTHGTATKTFNNGAYISDPLHYFYTLVGERSGATFAVGGDAGGGHTKLGFTYQARGVQTFAALLVYEGSDHAEQLHALKAANLTPFTGDSADCADIFIVLQRILDSSRRSFLNGDWPFINCLLGLKNASATHPCPICIINKSNLLGTSRYREQRDQLSRNPDFPPLLTIPPERIVPTPLHLFLGISNRIILEVYAELLGEKHVNSIVARARTVHSAGCGGAADIHQLNGPEISRFISSKSSTAILEAAAAESAIAAATRATHSILDRWLQQMQAALLHTRDWDSSELESWRCVVSDIHDHWLTETTQRAFPKLHMLKHSVEFAERHRFLGRVSESQIESYHAQFNSRFHKQHLNKSNDTAVRLRRSLADLSLCAIQPLLQAEKK